MSFSDSSRLLIVGASTRAAAASAIRAGFHPVCVDRFGDEDLRRIATVVAVNDDLHRTLDAILTLPPMPWIYTGSLENDPKFIAVVSERHTLAGIPSDVLKLVRDPFWLERTLRTNDLPALRVQSSRSSDAYVRTDPRPNVGVRSTGERWLLKPMRSGGGFRIAPWSGQPPPANERFYLQEHRPGTPMSALFIASPKEAELIGVCEQLIGPEFGAPTEFGYAGSIGPITVSDRTRELLQRLGNTLTREAQLRGLFGIDFILADDIPWLVELNPRYTASVEVLERALGRALLADLRHAPLAPSGRGARGEGQFHADADRALPLTPTPLRILDTAKRGDPGVAEVVRLRMSRTKDRILTNSATEIVNGVALTPDPSPRRGDGRKACESATPTAPRIVGKQILFAASDLTVPDLETPFESAGHTPESPIIADIPAPGTRIAAGWPICTVFAEAENSTVCQERLTARVQWVYQAICE